jgi:hypothetical protein
MDEKTYERIDPIPFFGRVMMPIQMTDRFLETFLLSSMFFWKRELQQVTCLH